ncbi:cation:proton antiporter [Sulfurospirillum arcachonense]|uniref:cation:proton antiporter n=1 Tax=Sulfurospirillum arcachonense TaxID=57666 RepID=UPI00046AF745|nr:cation:proton antiporter [Sulfurospirillum arcachonense]
MNNFLVIILTATTIAILLNLFLKRFHVPTIIGYIFTGTLISYIFHLYSSDELNHIAEFGIVFLMFTIGLEFSINHLMSMKKEVFFNGALQVLITGGIFSLLAQYIFDIPEKSAIIIGFAFALSSTAIVLKILNDSGNIHTVHGRKVLGILLFQDIAVIPLLLMINIFATDSNSLSSLLLETFISALIVLGLLFVIGKYFLNSFFAKVVSSESDEIFVASVLLIVVGASYLAHAFGFTYSLGAFIAGMMISETKYKHQVEADLIPFRDLLLGLFFITIGMQIDISIIQSYFIEIILLLIAVMIIKTGVIFTILVTYVNKRISFKSALSICQVGEFSLAVFALASASSLLDPVINQILIVMVALSMILTPFILRNVKFLADLFIKEEANNEHIICSSGLHDHIIVCGYGKLGQEIVYRLKKMDVKFLVIEHDINLVKLGQERNEPVFFGNAAMKSILKQCSVKTCKAVIVAINNEKKLRLICELLNSFKEPINTVVKVADYEEKKLLKDLDVNHIVNEGREVAKSLIKEALV